MTLLVDASALYALLDRDDVNHRAAAKAFPSLLDQKDLLTHNYVVVAPLDKRFVNTKIV